MSGGAVDWAWVRGLLGRIVLAAFLVGTFAAMVSARPEPGGATALLPWAAGVGALVAVAVAAVAGAVLVIVARRRGGQ